MSSDAGQVPGPGADRAARHRDRVLKLRARPGPLPRRARDHIQSACRGQASSVSTRIGPEGDGDHVTPANLSVPVIPNLRASSCCPSASTLAQKCPARSISGQVAEVRLGQNSTSGGASDSAANAWQANPAGPCGPDVVITVTPVQKWPRTCRNRAVSWSHMSWSAWGGKAVAPEADRGALPADPA